MKRTQPGDPTRTESSVLTSIGNIIATHTRGKKKEITVLFDYTKHDINKCRSYNTTNECHILLANNSYYNIIYVKI